MSDPDDIAAIVLAAGSSSRFGSDKLLHPITLNGVTLPVAAHSLLPWLETFARITVVVRPESEGFCGAIERSLGTGRAALRWLVCEDAASGMAASIACGVRARTDAAGWMIGLADMPAVPSAAIAGVQKALLNGADLSAATCNGRRGHPVGFSARYCEELLALKGDEGARTLLQRDRSKLVQIEISSTGIIDDVDVPEHIRLIEQRGQ